MSKYARTAVDAAQRCGHGVEPSDAWEQASIGVFGRGTSSQLKSCPRSAFLGLAGAGLIVGVPPGRYTRSESNVRYAVEAARHVLTTPGASPTASELWAIAMRGDTKRHNAQMDVVLGLHQAGLLRITDQ